LDESPISWPIRFLGKNPSSMDNSQVGSWEA
jgi:hypothetical protein